MSSICRTAAAMTSAPPGRPRAAGPATSVSARRGARGTDPGRAEPGDDAAGQTWLKDLDDDPPLRLYLALLRIANPTLASLAEHGIPPSLAEEALPALEQRGMVERRAGGALHVVPPGVALPAQVGALERRAQAIRGLAPLLDELYRTARQPSDSHPPAGPRTVVLTSSADADATGRRLAASASQSIDIMTSAGHLEWAAACLLGRADRASERRLVLGGDALDDENAAAQAHELRAAGIDVRITARIPFTLEVVDARRALMRAEGEPASGALAAFEIRQGQLAEMLGRVFRLTFDYAVPMPATRASAFVRARSRDERVLALLAMGATDSMVARRLGVSERTVERSVRTLLGSLGAKTRFQAGVQAARRGLL